MLDVRFPTALQMLLTLASAERKGYPQITSAVLADGVGSTASLARRLLVPLARDGIVRATLGKHGGISLARPAERITLVEIYRSVVGEKPLIAGRSDVPHVCDVSSRIETYFKAVAEEAERAMLDVLGRRTLAASLDELMEVTAAAATR